MQLCAGIQGRRSHEKFAGHYRQALCCKKCEHFCKTIVDMHVRSISWSHHGTVCVEPHQDCTRHESTVFRGNVLKISTLSCMLIRDHKSMVTRPQDDRSMCRLYQIFRLIYACSLETQMHGKWRNLDADIWIPNEFGLPCLPWLPWMFSLICRAMFCLRGLKPAHCFTDFQTQKKSLMLPCTTVSSEPNWKQKIHDDLQAMDRIETLKKAAVGFERKKDLEGAAGDGELSHKRDQVCSSQLDLKSHPPQPCNLPDWGVLLHTKDQKTRSADHNYKCSAVFFLHYMLRMLH